mgnify:CR=1 FL=1
MKKYGRHLRSKHKLKKKKEIKRGKRKGVKERERDDDGVYKLYRRKNKIV